MIQEVIEYYNAVLGAMPYFSNVYGISEPKTAKDIKRPVIYVDGNYEDIKLNTKGTSYFRKRSDVTITESVSQVSCRIIYSFTVPLLLFAVTKRDNFPANNSYSADRLAATLIKGLTFKNGNLKQQIGAASVTSKASLYSTDSQRIISEEFSNLGRNDFNHKDLVVGVNIDLVISSYTDCLIDPCDYIPKFCLQLESYVALP